MLLALYLNNGKKINGEAFNFFGPNTNKNYNVKDCLKAIKRYWPGINWKKQKKLINLKKLVY